MSIRYKRQKTAIFFRQSLPHLQFLAEEKIKEEIEQKLMAQEEDLSIVLSWMIRLEQEEIEAQRKEDELFFQQTIDYFGL